MKKNNRWSLMALCFCLFGALTFTACGDDDNDDNGKIDSPIVGTWQSVEEYNDDDYWSKHVDEYVFESNGKFEHHLAMYNDAERRNVAHEGITFSGSYTVNGQVVKMHYTSLKQVHDGREEVQEDFNAYDDEATFTINSNQLTFHFTADGRSWEEGPYTKR